MSRQGVRCSHVAHWWFEDSECDRRAGHEGHHAVVGADLYWNDSGDQVFPLARSDEHTSRGRAADSPRWCEVCQAWGDHHTDRHPNRGLSG